MISLLRVLCTYFTCCYFHGSKTGGGSFDFIASLPGYIDYRMFMHYIGENLINNLVGIYGMHLVKIHIYGNILVYEFS